MPNGRTGALPSHGVSGPGAQLGRWDCNVCGISANYASRSRCRICDAYAPRGGGAARGGGNNNQNGGGGGGGSANRWKGNAGGGGSGGGGGRPGGGTTAVGVSPTTTLAQRQIQQQEAALQKQLAEARRREELLRAENLRLQNAATRGGSGGGGGGANEGDEMEEDEDISEDDRRKLIDDIKNGMPYLLTRFGEESAEVARAKADLAALERAAREAKPYKTHRAGLERRKARLEKQQEKGREEAEQLLAQIETLQSRLNSVNRANDERERTIATVDGELRELLRKAISEGDHELAAPVAPAVDPSVAWQTVTATLESLVTKPGVPQDWAAQLSGLVEQLRVAAVAVQQRADTAPADAAISVPAPHAPATPSPSTLPALPIVASSVGSAAASSTTAPAPNGGAAQQQQLLDWEKRALELAFAEGGDGGGGAVQQTGNAAEAPPTEYNSDGDSESDDDMASVVGDEFNLREGESEAQRKQRIAQHLRDRRKRLREAKKKENKSNKKKEAAGAGGNKDGPRVKPSSQKKK